jgi:hypothetical protein
MDFRHRLLGKAMFAIACNGHDKSSTHDPHPIYHFGHPLMRGHLLFWRVFLEGKKLFWPAIIGYKTFM